MYRWIGFFLLALFGLARPLQALPAGQQTYFLMGNEHQMLDILDDIALVNGQAGFIPTPPSGANTIIAVTYPKTGQIIVYDHGEDGYEDDLYNIPAGNLLGGGGTTEIWGDGNPANGFPPDYPSDVMPDGSVFELESTARPNVGGCGTKCDLIPLPRVNTDIRYGGEDILFTVGQPLNVVHVVFPANTANDTIIGGTWEVFPIETYERSLTYTIPVGEDTYANNSGDTGNYQAFRLVYATCQATEDDTAVIVNNGTTTVSFRLDKGQHWSSLGAIDTTANAALGLTINQNTTITGDKPIQVGMISAGTGTFQSRYYNVIPTALYASEYMSPVFSGAAVPALSGADVIINNPGPNPITIDVEYNDAAGAPQNFSFVVPPFSPGTFRENIPAPNANTTIPNGSAVRFTSTDLFWGIGVAYAGGLAAGQNGTGGDWGWSLQPNGFLDREIAVPHGPGRREHVTGQAGGAGINGGNSSPIWVAVLEDATTVTVDWNGDGVPDQADIDNDQVGDGVTFTMNALQSLTLYDPNDDIQTGATISANGLFTAAWGDNRTGAVNDTDQVFNLDWGYTINPFDIRFLKQIIDVDKVAIPNSAVAGDTVNFEICATTATLAPVSNMDLVDVLPLGWTYVPNSAVITFPDSSTVMLEPTITPSGSDGDRLTWDISQTLAASEKLCVDFDAVVNACTPSVSNPTDDFASGNYSGGSPGGTGTDWAGDWLESGEESDGPAAGRIQVVAGELRVRRGTTNPRNVTRIVDTSGYCSPRLSFSRRLGAGLDAAGEGVALSLSSDGVNFVPLKVYTNADPVPSQVDTYDISGFRSATTHIRFSGLAGDADTDEIFVDDVSVSDAGFTPTGITERWEFPRPPANPASYQAGTGWPAAWVEFADAAPLGDPTAGFIQVVAQGAGVADACIDSQHVQLDGGTITGANGAAVLDLRRQIDVTGFTTPQISFDWSHFVSVAGENYQFQESVDGGGTFPNVLRVWDQPDNALGCTRSTFNLTPGVPAGQHVIRFIGEANMEAGQDFLIIDNIEVLDGGAPAPPKQVVNRGESTGNFQGAELVADDEEPIYISPIRLTKTVDNPTAEVGDTLTYTITVENTGATPETNIEIRDAVPPFTTFVAATGTPVGVFDAGSKSVSWGTFTLAPAEIRVFTFTATVNTVPFDETPIRNIAALLQNGDRCVEASVTATIIRTPVLINLFKDAPSSVPPGGDIPYTFDLENAGVADATNFTLVDRVPNEGNYTTQYVVGSATISAGTISFSNDGGVTFTYVPVGAAGVVDPAVTHIRWQFGTLPAGTSVTAGFTARDDGTATTVPPDILPTVRNVGRVTNDQTTVRVTNIPETYITDLALDITTTLGVNGVCPGDSFTITGTAQTNTGTFTNPIVTIPVPADTEYTSGTTFAPAGWTTEWSTDNEASYVATEPSPSSAVTHIRFSFVGSVPPASTFPAGYDVRVDDTPTPNTNLVIDATITTNETGFIINEEVVPIMNLRVLKSANRSVVNPALGQTITYTLRVDHLGSLTATGVVLEDPLPANTTFVAASDGGTNVSGVVTWNLGNLIPGASLVRTMEVAVAGGTAPGTTINNQANIDSQICTQLSEIIPVVVANAGVTAGPNSTKFGDQNDVVYHDSATITNTGTLDDRIELTFVNDNPAWPTGNVEIYLDVDKDGTYDPGLDTLLTDTGGAASVDTGLLAPSASIDVILCVTIPAGVPDGDANITTVTATSGINPANTDSFQDTTNVNTATAITLLGVAARGAAGGGVEVTWTTGTERQNQGFRVYRAAGRGGPWSEVGCCLIPGAGTSARSRDYRVLDPDAPVTGPLYYRLSDLDFRGGVRYHAPVAVDRDGDGLDFEAEARFGLSDADPADGAADPDGDGVSTRDEVRSGRDPGVADVPAGAREAEIQGDTPPPSGVRVIERGADRLVVELTLRDFGYRDRVVDGTAYRYPQLLGLVAGRTELPGSPSLPVVGYRLPAGFTGLEVLASHAETHEDVLVGPAPGVENGGSNLPPVYRVDPAFYGAPPPAYPAEAAEVRAGPAGGHPTLVFHPFSYDHAGRRLVFRSRIRVALRRETGARLQALAVDQGGLAAIPPGTVYRLRTDRPGLYRITGAQLRAAGADPGGVDPRHVGLYLGGVEVAIRLTGEADGFFHDADVLEFYAADPGDRYAAGAGYHLLYGSSPRARWASRATDPLGGARRGSYRHTETVEYREVYGHFDGPREADRWAARRDRWATSQAPKSFDIAVTAPAATGAGAVVRFDYGSDVYLASPSYHRHRLRFDGNPIGEGRWEGGGLHQAAGFVPPWMLAAGTRSVELAALTEGLPTNALDVFSPQKLSLEYDRQFVAAGDALRFPAEATGEEVQITGFTQAGIEVLDVRDPQRPVRITGGVISGAGPFAVTFGQSPTATYEVFAYTPAAGRLPTGIRPVTRADLRAAGNAADWLAVVPAGWEGALAPLVAARQAEGLRTMVVSMDDVADEFTSGVTHPEAIRRLLVWARANWVAAPRYLLLGGDGNANPRGYPGVFVTGFPFTSDPVLIPTPLSMAGPVFLRKETPDDLWYGRLEGGDAVPEVAVGRLHAKSMAQLAAMAQKIADYDGSTGVWTQTVLSVADDVEPAFHEFAEASLGAVLPGLGVQRFHLGGAGFPDTATFVSQFNQALADGAAFMSFVGHGSQYNWTASPTLMDHAQATALGNSGRLPVVVSMTCEDGYFGDVLGPTLGGDSLAEVMLRAPGAAVAYLASGVQSSATAKDLYHRSFNDALFQKDQRRLGDAIRQAYAAYAANSSDPEGLLGAFNLFGDPATEIRLASPKMPGGLQVTPLADGTLRLSWTAPAGGGITGYEVLRRVGAAAAVSLATVTATEFVDAAVPAGTTVYYTVRALKAGGLASALPTEVGAAALPAAVTPPAGGGGGGGGGGCRAGAASPAAAWPLWLLLTLGLPLRLRRMGGGDET